jgi:hypothetical protein
MNLVDNYLANEISLLMLKDAMANEVFDSLVKIHMGNCKRILFWKDGRIQGVRVNAIAPPVITRRQNFWTVEAALLNNNWLLELTREMTN